MEWQDEGLLLAMRRHGEGAAILELFTACHGRCAGILRGGGSRKVAPLLQPGAQFALGWRARLDDHLGTLMAEPLRSRAVLMEDRLALAGLNAICALLHLALPERDPQPDLYRHTQDLLAVIERDAAWPGAYLRWELALLEIMGFGLELGRCAVTGTREDLAYVSPRTGRAVSRAGAGEWASRLLPLPQGLLGQGPVSGGELAQGLAITGHFLGRELPALRARDGLPVARQRLLDLLLRATP